MYIFHPASSLPVKGLPGRGFYWHRPQDKGFPLRLFFRWFNCPITRVPIPDGSTGTGAQVRCVPRGGEVHVPWCQDRGGELPPRVVAGAVVGLRAGGGVRLGAAYIQHHANCLRTYSHVYTCTYTHSFCWQWFYAAATLCELTDVPGESL